MPSSARTTIKSFAHDYFMRTSFVDIHGRNIGYDYDHILGEIKSKFPKARTSRPWLQKMAYNLNRDVRLPVRRRSRLALSEEFAKALLLYRNGRNVYRDIGTTVQQKFPEYRPTPARLKSMEIGLRNRGYVIPPRPE